MNISKIKTFLQQNTVIPNIFINTYLDMVPINSLQTDLVVDLDVVSKWLGVRKDNIFNTLSGSYKKGIDYNVTASARRVPHRPYGGNNYKKVMLTPDCFKRLCMLSRSKNAEMVRTYYIQLESFIFKYYEQTIVGMEEEIKELEKANKPKSRKDHAGYIYVIRASHKKDSIYKLGRAKDLYSRLKTYQTGKLEDIEVVFKYRTDNLKAMESCVKLALKERQYRKYKELYEADLDMIKELIESCAHMENVKQVYTMRAASKLDGGYYIGLFKDNE